MDPFLGRRLVMRRVRDGEVVVAESIGVKFQAGRK